MCFRSIKIKHHAFFKCIRFVFGARLPAALVSIINFISLVEISWLESPISLYHKPIIHSIEQKKSFSNNPIAFIHSFIHFKAFAVFLSNSFVMHAPHYLQRKHIKHHQLSQTMSAFIARGSSFRMDKSTQTEKKKLKMNEITHHFILIIFIFVQLMFKYFISNH